ncbi:auxin-induced protein X15-like [Curcuma longa]|uniref:auxin-induced protein X15-like n=1 Tax=Curcuma longa TaxID=136217 RepID=UPI003D9E0F35
MAVLFFIKGRKKSSQREKEVIKDSLLHGKEMAVPKGCMAVYVGEELRRFVIPTSYLCLPVFRPLMERVKEEFGFDQAGGLRIPCDEEDFERLLQALRAQARSSGKKGKKLMRNFI